MISTSNNLLRMSVFSATINSPHDNTASISTTIKSRNGLAPATILEISDRAKTLLSHSKSTPSDFEKSKDFQSVSISKDLNKYLTLAPRNISTLTPISFFDSLMSPGSKDIKPNAAWQAGAPYGDAMKSDALFIRDLGLSSLSMDAAGWPPEVGQALDNAIRTGTIKIQRASEIEGLNFKSSHTFAPNKNNGTGYDTAGGTTQNPTGDLKKAIDSGRALAMWTADRGDVYLSW